MIASYRKFISQKSRSPFSLDKGSENLPVSFFLGWQNPLHLLPYPSEVGHPQVFAGSCPGCPLVSGSVLFSCSVYSLLVGSVLQGSPGKGAWGGANFLNLCVPPKVILVPFTQYLAWLVHAQAGNDFPSGFWRVVTELPALLLSSLVPF